MLIEIQVGSQCQTTDYWTHLMMGLLGFLKWVSQSVSQLSSLTQVLYLRNFFQSRLVTQVFSKQGKIATLNISAHALCLAKPNKFWLLCFWHLFTKKVTQKSKKLPKMINTEASKFWLKDGTLWSELSKVDFKSMLTI